MNSFTQMVKNIYDVLKTYKRAGAYVAISCADDCYVFTDGEHFYGDAPVPYNPEGPTAEFQKTHIIYKHVFLEILKNVKKGDTLEIQEIEDSLKFSITKADGTPLSQVVKSDTRNDENYVWEFAKECQGKKENRIDFTDKKEIRNYLNNALPLLNDTYHQYSDNVHFYNNEQGVILAQTISGKYVTEKRLTCREMPALPEMGLHLQKAIVPAIIKLCDVTSPASHLQFSWYRMDETCKYYKPDDLVEVMAWWCDGKVDAHQTIVLRGIEHSDASLNVPLVRGLDDGRVMGCRVRFDASKAKDQLKNNGFLGNPKSLDVVVKDCEWAFYNKVSGMSSLCKNDFKVESAKTEPPLRMDAKVFQKIFQLVDVEPCFVDFLKDSKDDKYHVGKLYAGNLTAWISVQEDSEDFYRS